MWEREANSELDRRRVMRTLKLKRRMSSMPRSMPSPYNQPAMNLEDEQEESWLPSPGSPMEDIQDVESSRVITSSGGSVSVNGMNLTCPPGVVDDPVTIKLTLEEPYKHCGLLVQRGLENDVMFVKPIINCQPNRLMFKKHITLTIPVNSAKEQSIESTATFDTLIVVHGKPTNETFVEREANSELDRRRVTHTLNLNRRMSMPWSTPSPYNQPAMNPEDEQEESWLQSTTTSATNPTESPYIQIVILDLKDDYHKVQTRSQRTSRMRIAQGEVNGMVRTTGEIKSIKAFVQRTPEAAKEVNDTTGPMELDVIYNKVRVQPVHFSVDLDSVIKTPDVKNVYSLSKVKSETRNIWQLIILVELVDGSNGKFISKGFRIGTWSRRFYGKSIPASPMEYIQVVESSRVVTSSGGSVSMYEVNLTCPPEAVDDPVTIKLTLEEPYKHCGLLVQRGLENDAIFVKPIVNCQPNGQKFKKHVTLTISLDSGKEQSIQSIATSDTLIVVHGTPTNDGKIFWKDISHNSKFDSKMKELKVEITHFSLIAVLLRLTWVQTKEIVTRLNLMSFNYMLSVLFKGNHQHSPFDELALMFMSQDIYQEQFYREHDDSALMQLKRDGFEELGSDAGHDRNFIYNKETLEVSIQLGEDYTPANNQQECITFAVDSSIWWSTGHVIKLPLKGSSADTKILCGKIIVRGQYGHVREENFCELGRCSYVRRLLGVENVIFNPKPVILQLQLPEETFNQVVTCWQSEVKQLEMILQRWREKQGDAEDLAALRKTLEGLGPEEYRVKERGQMHIKHLRELAMTILGLQHKDPNMMKYLGIQIKNLCKSVLRDCCIETAISKEELDLATSSESYCASLLEINRQVSKDVAMKYRQICWSPEESITENFLVIVSQLIQAIKEIFRDKKVPQEQSGLRGLAEETILNKITLDIQAAAQDKSILRLLIEVCNILENLCLNNNHSQTTEDEIHKWGGSANIFAMLNFLGKFFHSSEAQRLCKRLEVFSVSIREIMSNPTAFEGNFLRDFHNVALTLLKFSKFDPSQLVRFELIEPINSSNTQGNDGLKYDKSKETFSQLFWISKESEDMLQLEAVARVHINGHIRSIGAFESLITLHASCSEAVDRIPIASLSVAVKREHDDSGDLCVTLYSTQKENVAKALKYLQNELEGDVIGLERAEISQSHLKVSCFATAGRVVRLRLVHKWGSETLVLDSNDFVALADSTAGGACVPDPEIAAEVGQLAIPNELPALPIARDSAVDNYSSNVVMDPSDAELIQRHLHEHCGRIEIHYHQNFLKGHVCVAGKNTSLNMQMPATGQRFLEAGPSTAPHRSITAGTGEDEE